MNRDRIEIVNPVGRRANRKTSLAKRTRDSLNGLRIGLLDNNKPNADKFLSFIGESLRQHFENLDLIAIRKLSRTEAECLPDLIARCDVVINAFAD
jgi:hypothetical protein